MKLSFAVAITVWVSSSIGSNADRTLQQIDCGNADRAPCPVPTEGFNAFGCKDELVVRFEVCTNPPRPPLPAGKCYPEKPLYGSAPLVDYYGAHNTYNFWVDNKYCIFTGDSSIVVDFSVLMYRVGTRNKCVTCNVPAQCQIWHPDSQGYYRGFCSASTSGNQFRIKVPYPGDEESKGFGYDPFAHIHYSCCCKKRCWKNKVYLTRSQLNFSIADDKLQTPDDSNIAEEYKPGFYRFTVVIPDNAPDNTFYSPSDVAPNDLKALRLSNPDCYKSEPQTWVRISNLTTNSCNQ